LVIALGCAQEEGATAPVERPKITAKLSLSEPPMLNILASDACPPYVQEDLKEPVKIHPVGQVLETQLIVALQDRCVPVFDAADGWTLQRLSLRTYGFPKDHSDRITLEEVTAGLDDPNMVWSAPGPTFVLNKASAPGLNDGSKFKMTLYNALPVQEDPHACDELERKAPGPQGPFQPDTAPNCFHGDNSTNFHYHGSHVSPQPHQDFVGLELLPIGAIPPEHGVHGARGVVAVGQYDYDLDPLRYTQAEGTHWYHAHKHGSTALQVLNGLIGTLEVRGEFDTQLEALFSDQGGLPDRLLVVQQLQENPSGLGQDPSGAPTPLINGQANPIVKMKPGEIQRWRFVGATMQASAQLDIGFPQGAVDGDDPEVMQIAMDGVQFAPANYACQPILRGPDCQVGTGDDSFKELNAFSLSPGDRIDLLVKAPDTPGRHVMTFKMTADLHESISDEVQTRLTALVQASNALESKQVSDPPLLTLEVVAGEPAGSEFPSQEDFPPMPEYLADLTGPFKARTVNYQMSDQGSLDQVRFSINDKAYDPACVNETLTLDEQEEWTLTNNSGIAHPFHIHTNPFQLISQQTWVEEPANSGTFESVPINYNPPYIWRDVLAIPTQGSGDSQKGQALIRYVAREFTGEFVNHCHILGHEDRGMMHNVQAVCPTGEYGAPTSDLSPECVPGNYLPAAPACEP
jgi:FtsP/CotA-like multicopper oxidase with cupredoxin domain